VESGKKELEKKKFSSTLCEISKLICSCYELLVACRRI
jgi:hypothetical protein